MKTQIKPKEEDLFPKKALESYLRDMKEDIQKLVKLLSEVQKIHSSEIKRPIEETISTRILEESERLNRLIKVFEDYKKDLVEKEGVK